MSYVNIQVDLDQFDDDDIIDKALDLIDDNALLEIVSDRGLSLSSQVADLDIVSQNLIDRFLEGFDRIDKQVLDKFLKKYDL